MANFCAKCGYRLSESDRFCPECGHKIVRSQNSPAANPSYTSGNNEVPQGRSYQENSQHAPRPPKEKKKGALCIFLAVVMVIELIVAGLKYPGFLIKNSDDHKTETPVQVEQTEQNDQSRDDDNSPVQPGPFKLSDDFMNPDPETNYKVAAKPEMQTVATGMITEENNRFSSGDISIEVNECFVEQDSEVTISKAKNTVDYHVEGITLPLTMYDFSVDGITDDTLITLEFPYSVPEGVEVGAGYYNEEEQTIYPVHFEYDTEKQVIRVTTTHLSTFCGFPVQNEYTRNCMIAYMDHCDLIDLLYDTNNISIENNVAILNESLQNKDSLSQALETYEKFDSGRTTVGAITSVAQAVGEVGDAMKIADGSGTKLMLNSRGTVGEIMNTMWGKAGSWGYSRRYGGNLKVVDMDDKLAQVYPTEFLKSTGTFLNRLAATGSVFKIIDHVRSGKNTDAGWEAINFSIDKALNMLGEAGGTSLGLYLVGVSLLGYALNTFYSTALEGRKNVYLSAYNKYYDSKDTDGGYRSSPEWMKVIKGIIKNGGGSEEINAEIDRYCNEFWVKADKMDIEYLANVMTKDEKAAWGVSGLGGLNDSIRKEISDNKKADLAPVIENVIRILNKKNQEEAMNNFFTLYEQMQRQMNQVITVRIIDGGKEEGVDSDFTGCIVRFKDIKKKVKDPELWQTTLDKKGQGYIQFRLLAHMLVNAGNDLEVVKMNGDREEIVLEQNFELKIPSTKVVLELSSGYNDTLNGFGESITVTSPNIGAVNIDDSDFHESAGINDTNRYSKDTEGTLKRGEPLKFHITVSSGKAICNIFFKDESGNTLSSTTKIAQNEDFNLDVPDGTAWISMNFNASTPENGILAYFMNVNIKD